MEYVSRIQTKHGLSLTVRSLTAQDAQAALWLMHACMGETPYLSRYPDELHMTVAQEMEFIETARKNPNGILLGAFAGDELIGMCSALPAAPGERFRHRVSFGMMVLKAHWGKGAGSALMDALLDVMRAGCAEQIELEVSSANAAAMALYEKYGFSRCGLLKRGVKYRDGSYADLVMMMRSLKED